MCLTGTDGRCPGVQIERPVRYPRLDVLMDKHEYRIVHSEWLTLFDRDR